MTEMYTKEPWTIKYEWNIFGAGGRLAATAGSHHDNITPHGSRVENLANARRIVACVNACAGIPTEKLENGAIQLFYKPKDATP